MAKVPKPRKEKPRSRGLVASSQGAMRDDPRSTWNMETVLRVCELLAEGTPLKQIARDAEKYGMPFCPVYETLRRWERDDPETGLLFARAREFGRGALVDQSLEIVDETASAKTMVQVAAAKLRSETRLRIAGMWDHSAARAAATEPFENAPTLEDETEAVTMINDLTARLADKAKPVQRIIEGKVLKSTPTKKAG